jgi:methionyl-tRNA synthetase
LRYYYAAKLGPGVDDIDLSLEDFVAKVNADLVGKLVNIASRCAGFIHRLNGGRLASALPESTLPGEFAAAEQDIAAAYESRDYARAMRRIMGLADRANQFIDERKPWVLAKDSARHSEAVQVCTLGLDCFRKLIILLKPVLPVMAERVEQFFGGARLTWQDLAAPILDVMVQPYETLAQRIDTSAIEMIKTESSEQQVAATAAPEPGARDDGLIDIETFSKIDLRVARVRRASTVEGADKLLQLELEVGDSIRTVFAGIRSAYRPEELEGRLVVVVANLKPRKMRFGVSEGMVLAAGAGGQEIFLLHPDSGAQPGMQVR